MKTIILTIFTILISSSGFYSQVKTNSKLKNITLYLDGAKVERTVNVSVKTGEQKILISNLSAKIEDKTVRINTTSDVKILSVTTRTNYITPNINGNSNKELKDSIARLTRENENLVDEIDAYIVEKEVMILNQKVNMNDNFSPTQMAEFADLFRTRTLKVNQKVTNLKRQKVKNDKRITTYKNHIQANRTTKTISQKRS